MVMSDSNCVKFGYYWVDYEVDDVLYKCWVVVKWVKVLDVLGCGWYIFVIYLCLIN